MDFDVSEVAQHLMVGSKSWKRCEGTKEECRVQFNMQLDTDKE